MSYDITEFGEIIQAGNIDIIKFHKMPPGFVAIIRTCSDQGFVQKQDFINQKLDKLSAMKEFQELDLETVNYALYKCDEEEKDYTEGKRGAYQIDGVPMMYAGIASIQFLIRSLKESQNLGSPLFNNVRDGNWLMDYILDRYRDHQSTQFLVPVLEEIFNSIKGLPKRSKPRYFSKVIGKLWNAFIRGQLKKLDPYTFKWITQDPFTIHLFESIGQFYGKVKSVKFGNYENSL